MGVVRLWPVLEDVKQTVGVNHLRGKSVAIDVTGWFVQAERNRKLVGKRGIRADLKTLFGRLSVLLRHHVRPVVVFDGTAPTLKGPMLEKRAEQKQRFYDSQQQAEDGEEEDSDIGEDSVSEEEEEEDDGDIKYLHEETDDKQAQSSSSRQKTSVQPVTRGLRYGAKTKEYQDLLDCLGVPYVAAEGEAEATCAYLNRAGFVDACMSDDSDIFLYGAKRVYKNFNVKSADNDIEYYDMEDVEEKLQLNREKLVAMALLTGCDFGAEGVKGIGKESSLKLLQELPSAGVLQRLRDWRSKDCDLDEMENFSEDKKPSHCSKCDHTGTSRRHQTSGCDVCRTPEGCSERSRSPPTVCPCRWHSQSATCRERAVEIRVRKLALVDADFPNEQIIQEFMRDPDPEPSWTRTLQWKRPPFQQLQAFLRGRLGWDDRTIVSRCLRLLTAWDMAETTRQTAAGDEPNQRSVPGEILHARTSKKIQVLDVQWKRIEGVSAECLSLAVPPSPTKLDQSSPGVTEEYRSDMEAAYPWIVNSFDITRAPAKVKRRLPIRDSKNTKQMKLDKMFQVRKKLNFAAAASTTTTKNAGPRSSDNTEMSVSGSGSCQGKQLSK